VDGLSCVEEGPFTAIAVEMKFLRQEMAEMDQDIKDLKERPCPSPKCQDHETRLTVLETHAQDKEKSGTSTLVKAGIVVTILLGLAEILISLGGR